MQVARNILAQLGGNKFIAMTGASNFLSDDNSLSFKLPSTPHFVKNKINHVKITFNGNDTYDIEYSRIWGMNKKYINEQNEVYVEMLRDMFTDMTGLDTHL